MNHREETTRSIRRSRSPGPLGVVLRVTNRAARPRELRLLRGSCVCGAGRGADLVITDETVSRRHVELSLIPEGVSVRDLESHNGTWYLGQRIQQAVIAIGSTLQLGRAELRVEADRESLDRISSGELDGYGSLVGSSAAMRRLFGLLTRLESSLVNVLIQGESGTGKELVAQAIHTHSSRSEGPFVALNCGALDRTLIRSELFGHKRGAFTGAFDQHTGAFEAASGGTLFLDEIGELPLDVQPVLLRALESGSVTRLGENNERPVQVRIVSATNRDLRAEVAARRFREDLYFRLAVVHLTVPPLRERLEDITLLANHFATELGVGELSATVQRELIARSWPGNARELKNAIQSHAVLGVLPECTTPRDAELDETLRRMLDLDVPYAEQKENLRKRFLRVYLASLLSHTGGNKSLAARVSGMQRSYLTKVVAQLRRGELPGHDEETDEELLVRESQHRD